jgi:hypothetical protein
MSHELSLRTEGVTYTTSCDDATGAFTFTGVSAPTIGAPIILWINDVSMGSVVGTTVTRNAGGVAGLNIYQNHLIIRHEDAGPTTNANLGTWDNDDDADIVYTSNGGALTTESGIELLVWANDMSREGR